MKTKTNLLVAGMLLVAVAKSVGQPVITSQPQSRTNVVGSIATFTVGATGAPPLSYQWVLNSLITPLPGATNDTLILPNVQARNAGNYRVVITNDAGSVLSVAARLRVVFPPVITNQPASQAGIRGNPAMFRVGASGTAPLAYQWYFNDTGLPGQTNSSLTLPLVGDFDAGHYFVTVINPYGVATSQVARLNIDLSAQVVVVPNAQATNDGNIVATLTGFNVVRYMQIHDASQFGALAGPAYLTRFAWRPDRILGQSGPRMATGRIYASTTTRSADGLSLTFAENLGTNNTLVFDGTLTWTTANLPGPGNTRQFDYVFQLTTPFLYDPAAGNLLLDFQHSADGSAITFDRVSRDSNNRQIGAQGTSALTGTDSATSQVTQFIFRSILSVRFTETNSVLISWPAPSTGFELQQNDDLGTTNWIAVGTAPATVGSENQVIVPNSVGTQFYRLRKP